MEAGSHLFLLDEDTSATNFMVRDAFMQQVIQREKEPITPFLERAGELYKKAGISTILVAGSSGAFFHIADTIIQMDNYVPRDITDSTKALCAKYPLPAFCAPAFTSPHSHRIMTKAPQDRLKTKVSKTDGFSLGRQEIDLRYTEQLIDPEQTATLSLLLKYAVENMINGKRTLSEIVEDLEKKLKKEGMSFPFQETARFPAAMPSPDFRKSMPALTVTVVPEILSICGCRQHKIPAPTAILP